MGMKVSLGFFMFKVRKVIINTQFIYNVNSGSDKTIQPLNTPLRVWTFENIGFESFGLTLTMRIRLIIIKPGTTIKRALQSST